MANNLNRVFDPTIDPNDPNINNNITNGIPQYQDMFIYAELTAISRGRSILSTDIDTDITRLDTSNSQGGRLISFLGQNQNPDSVNYNKFTTNYYDGSSNEEITYEGFGIQEINVYTNSSYIPQVDIEFVDVKGLAFFNRENSPYRILFNFPPPIFHLTLKGYYGKATTYQLHLVKYNSEFKSESGNYHINASFIAITYAPLTDIPFRYILQAPFMLENTNIQSLSQDVLKPPENTLDLILKLERLYDESQEKIKNDFDFINYERSQKKLNNYNEVYTILNNYGNDRNFNEFTPKLFTYNTTPNSESYGEVQIIKNYGEYEKYLRSFGTTNLPSNIDRRVFIGFLFEIQSQSNLDNEVARSELSGYKNFIFNKTNRYFTDIERSDISDPQVIRINNGSGIIQGVNFIGFLGIDFTDYFTKLYKDKISSNELKSTSVVNLNDTINNMVQQNLGMIPTIYNVFEIILRDVDRFFNVLKKTSIDAEEHHETYENNIINHPTYKDVETKIYPFPLVIERQTNCNQTTEIRKAPIELSNKLDEPFPELELVQKFIDSFIQTKRIEYQRRLKDERDANGDYKWIPFTPLDSKTVGNVSNSPYYGIDTTGDNVAVNLNNNDRLSQVFEIMLNRFYVLSQNSLAYSFYGLTPPKNNDQYDLYDNSNVNDLTYVELYARSEAQNLANSIINEDYGQLLKQFSSANKNANNLNGANGFYTYVSNNTPNIYNNSVDSIIISGEQYKKNKNSQDYRGLTLISLDNISERTGAPNDDFSRFIENNKTTWFKRIFSNRDQRLIEETFKFSEENFIIRKDSVTYEDNNLVKNNNRTKFLAPYRILDKNDNNVILKDLGGAEENVIEINNISAINELTNKGNLYFFENNIEYSRNITTRLSYPSIYNVWSNALADNDEDFYDIIIDYESPNYNRRLAALMVLSNWGYTLSPFNYYPFFLNKDYFSTPSLVEVPRFMILYMGLLVGVSENDNFWNNIYDFFVNGSGRNIDNGGLFIFGDIYDINNNLSVIDRAIFLEQFQDWYENSFDNIQRNLKELYISVQEEINDENDGFIANLFESKRSVYNNTLETDYSSMITNLIQRNGLVCFNEITFRYDYDVLDPEFRQNAEEISNNFIPLADLLNDDNRVNITNTYFTTFFNELEKKIDERVDDLQQEREDFNLSTSDEDIVTSTYYSFKTLNDKWLAGLNKNINGYPFKTNSNEGFISQFAFVDRAMNPVGDTILDLKTLVDLKDNTEVSIFTVLSQILSINGFEFFPLQNFLKFTEDDWTESFRINVNKIQKQYPVFVCMYLGGSASYPTGLEKYAPFKDDGIESLDDSNFSEFFNDPCDATDPRKDRQLEYRDSNGDMYSNVRAFKVRYGEQNQNMFYDFGVDSKEYPETNESIQILSRIAGDNKQNSPVPKAQNLYNLYENRAYKSSITGLGNVMIQPTQYFQLENVPLYNGVYMILEVEHNIVPNKMTTKFSGTKIPKYPQPRVLDAASIFGFEGGNSSETDPDQITIDEVIEGVGTGNNPNQARYNSMYTLNIGF